MEKTCVQPGYRMASTVIKVAAASVPAGTTSDRVLAMLELLCTFPGGATVVGREALATAWPAVKANIKT